MHIPPFLYEVELYQLDSCQKSQRKQSVPKNALKVSLAWIRGFSPGKRMKRIRQLVFQFSHIQTNGDIFHFQKFFNSVMSSLAAQAALFIAAEGDLDG